MGTSVEQISNQFIPTDLTELRLEFRKCRLELGYSQQYVATEILGVTQATLSAWETGRNKSMRSETLNSIFHLVRDWQTQIVDDSNIVPIGTGERRPKAPAVESRVMDQRERRERARQKLEHAVKSYLGPERASHGMIEDLSWKDLIDLYALTRLG